MLACFMLIDIGLDRGLKADILGFDLVPLVD
jgi:hypothetical protein